MSGTGSPRRALVRAVAALALVGATSCSFVTMPKLPPAYRADVAPRCAFARGAVYTDYALTAMATELVLAYAFIVEPADRDDQEEIVQSAVMYGLAGVAAFTSARWGAARRRECKAARAAHEAWLRSLPAEPGQPAPSAAPGATP